MIVVYIDEDEFPNTDDISGDESEDDDNTSQENESEEDEQEEEQRQMVTRSQAHQISTQSRNKKKKSKIEDGIREKNEATTQNPITRHTFKKPRYNRVEKEFLEHASKSLRTRLNEEESRVWNSMHRDMDAPIRFRILESQMPPELKARAIRKVEEANGDMSAKTLHWLNGLLSIPFGKYAEPRGMRLVDDGISNQTLTTSIKTIQTHLDDNIYGHHDTKDQIVRLLAQWLVNPVGKGMSIGIGGPPGIGKTHLCQALCECLGIPFGFIPLGGASGGCYMDGHSSTYEGATWGKIVDILMKTGCANPVFYFDELDKVSESHHGTEVSNILIHMTDLTQNHKFNDRFFMDVDIDLSRSLMLFSYNDISNINPVLLDRLVTIQASGYNINDKVAIARKHLIPSLEKEFAGACTFNISDHVLRYVISRPGVSEEQGVRALKRALYDILSHVNLQNLVKGRLQNDEITIEDVDKFVSFGNVLSGGGPMSESVKAMYM